MTKVVAVTEAFKSLNEVETVETRLGLTRQDDRSFFGEWQTDLPELSLQENDRLRLLHQRLRYHRGDGDLLEGAVVLLVVSPLLELAGFYDPPFKIKVEVGVDLTIDDGEEILRGRIDVLVLQQKLWLLVIAAKKSTLSTRSALPQALAYMMANGNPTEPTYGMITNGDDVLFIKLASSNHNSYSLSRSFSLGASELRISINTHCLCSYNEEGNKQRGMTMLKMTDEDHAKLKTHINETAALLRKYTEPEKLATFESIELELREQMLNVVAPQIGEFFSLKGASASVLASEASKP
jgi:hypothetical protein